MIHRVNGRTQPVQEGVSLCTEREGDREGAVGRPVEWAVTWTRGMESCRDQGNGQLPGPGEWKVAGTRGMGSYLDQGNGKLQGPGEWKVTWTRGMESCRDQGNGQLHVSY